MLPMSQQLNMQMDRINSGRPRIDDRVLHLPNPMGGFEPVKVLSDTYREQMRPRILPLQIHKDFCDVDTTWTPPVVRTFEPSSLDLMDYFAKQSQAKRNAEMMEVYKRF